MSISPETRAALARYEEWVERTVKSPDAIANSARRVGRATRSVGRRLRNMVFATFFVLLGAFLYGNLVAPLGFLGVVVTMMAVLCAMILFATWPPERQPKLDKLPETPLKALPGQVEEWLSHQQRALPAPAARDVDRIMAQLDRLAPELETLNPASPEADDARRLIADHLPRLVRSYAEVPATHRATPEAQAHLRDGLKVVGTEIDRLTHDLARDRLRALETEGRFLESRYKGGVPDKES